MVVLGAITALVYADSLLDIDGGKIGVVAVTWSWKACRLLLLVEVIDCCAVLWYAAPALETGNWIFLRLIQVHQSVRVERIRVSTNCLHGHESLDQTSSRGNREQRVVLESKGW